MKLSWEPLTLRTRRPFRISAGGASSFEGVLARLEHAGVVGVGEAAPRPRVTGETPESVGHFLAWAAKEVEPLAPDALPGFLAHVHDDICGNPAARCALDLAAHDLLGKLRGVPARELLGVAAGARETTMTVSLAAPEEMAEEARAHAAAGFRLLKLKLGDAAADLARVEAVRAALPGATLRVDANAGWSREEARALLPGLARLDVEWVEQPLEARDARGLADFSRESRLPLLADESVLDVHDVRRLHEAGFRGGVNVKLQKAGGLAPALVAVREARRFGLAVQAGCNVESPVGIHGALQLLAEVDLADLDGDYLLADAPARPDPLRRSPAGPGLGLG